MSKEIKPAILPDSLRKEKPTTVSGMRVETPQYVTPDFVYMREGTGELMLDRCEVIPEKSGKPSKELGLVGIMLVAVVDGDEMITAHVADLRDASVDNFGNAPDAEAPEDPDDLELWQSEIECMLPIAAFVYRDPSDKRSHHPLGDERFIAAALHLAQLTDSLKSGTKLKLTRNTTGETNPDAKPADKKKSAKKAPKK